MGDTSHVTPTLVDPQVLLRPPRASDIDDRLAFNRDAEYLHMIGKRRAEHAPLTRDEAARWYERVAQLPHFWVIDVEGRGVGQTQLTVLDEHDRRARFSIGIYTAAHRGRGIGTAATRLVLAYAFERIGLHRVDLRVLAYNRRAVRSYMSLGFVQEGVERESALVDGAWHDDIMMSILEHEHRR